MNNYDRITQSILNALENGTPAWRRPWRTLRGTGTASTPRNAISGRSYSGVNWMLLACEPYPDQRWLTYRQAQEIGGHVRKGEHGQQVIFWQPRDYKKTQTDGSEKLEHGLILKTYTVFNVAQCDGIALNATGDDTAELPPVADLYRTLGARVTHGGDRACYIPSVDMINLPPLAAFSSPDGYTATALHELTHWTGHKSRCDRDLKNRFGTAAYAAEELVAELGSAYLCAEYGIDQTLENHAPYIHHWRQLLTDDPRAIITAASKATAAANWIRDRVTAESAPDEQIAA